MTFVFGGEEVRAGSGAFVLVPPGVELSMSRVQGHGGELDRVETYRGTVDETLDVLAAHGMAGFTGILFIGFFAQAAWNGISDGWVYDNLSQLGDQALAALVAPAYAFGMTYLLLRLIALVMPLRGAAREEALGMDVIHHGEAYASGDGAILVPPESGVEEAVPVRAS